MNKRSRRWWLVLRMFSGWFEFEVRAALILSRSAAFGGVTCRERPVAWRAECDYVVTGWERTDGAPSSGRFARCCACEVSSSTRYQRRPDSKRRISFIPSHSNVLGIEHCAGSILCGSSCSVPHSHRSFPLHHSRCTLRQREHESSRKVAIVLMSCIGL